MGWDLFPLELMQKKRSVLEEAALRRDLVFFTHEDEDPFARVEVKPEDIRLADADQP
jgi:hypothetical protein